MMKYRSSVLTRSIDFSVREGRDKFLRNPSSALAGSWQVQQRQKSTCAVKSPISFAFDIDGVLLKSSKPIAGAIEALNLLKKYEVPFILLTNGGGLSESARVANLSRYLRTTILPSQFIQSHTPFRGDVERYGYENVLVCGGVLDECRRVALGYGFPHVTVPMDVLASDGAVWPYHTLTDEERACTRPVKADRPVDAIYVFHDPRDWGLDSQIIIDTLLSDNGRPHTRQRGMVQQAVPIYFSNPDLLWANAYELPRLGQGAFKLLIEGLFRAVSGRELESVTIGKPSRRTFEYADTVLSQFKRDALIKSSSSSSSSSTLTSNTKPLDGDIESGKVYMVGDNKLSDIQGANDYGWESILVQTGVFDGTPEEGCSGAVPAKYCVANVKEAVEMVLNKEGII